MKKRQIKKDFRVKSKHISWKEYVLTYFILLVLTSGQGMIYGEYLDFDRMPPEYIGGMLGYWAIVTAIFCVFVGHQKLRAFDKPMRKLSEAAKQVAVCGCNV